MDTNDIFDTYTEAAKPNVIIGTNMDGTPKTARHPGAFTSEKPSPYEASGAADLATAEDYRNNPDALYNDRAPRYEIKSQKPEHRTIIFLKAEGNTNREIARVMGMSEVAISNILRQPWARTQLLDEINKAGRNEVVTIFKGAAAEVAQQMVDIVNNPEARAGDKISAGHLILDRLFGKATQPLAHSFSDSDLKSMSDEQLMKLASGSIGSN
jgi:hypothetical protein